MWSDKGLVWELSCKLCNAHWHLLYNNDRIIGHFRRFNNGVGAWLQESPVGDADNFHNHTQLVKAILELLSRDCKVRLSHVFKYENGVVDSMASLAKGLSIGCHKFQSPPVQVSRPNPSGT